MAKEMFYDNLSRWWKQWGIRQCLCTLYSRSHSVITLKWNSYLTRSRFESLYLDLIQRIFVILFSYHFITLLAIPLMIRIFSYNVSLIKFIGCVCLSYNFETHRTHIIIKMECLIQHPTAKVIYFHSLCENRNLYKYLLVDNNVDVLKSFLTTCAPAFAYCKFLSLIEDRWTTFPRVRNVKSTRSYIETMHAGWVFCCQAGGNKFKCL